MARVTKTTANEVFLDERGIIHTVYHGMQTGHGLQQTVDRMKRVIDILVRADKPIHVLIDIRDLREYDPQARLVEMHARTILPFWKLAFVTNDQHSESEEISRKLTLMSGRRKEIRYFKREDDAIGWLRVMAVKTQ